MVKKLFIFLSILISLGTALLGVFSHYYWFFAFIVIIPIICIGIYDLLQTKHTILKNFPVVGHFRYMLESFAPEIQQYFIERRTDGSPIDKNKRSLVYRRSKGMKATHPFGTELNIYAEGHEFISQSLYPKPVSYTEPRVLIGGEKCTQPYSASMYNISAMSYGSLSKNAVMALNNGAKQGGFFHNTGEGGVSPYHLQGGDVVWQIGTGYFGCRTDEGGFSRENYTSNALRDEVKMIEIKLSQGAKPGHGGVLPGVKNTKEIAAIRGVEPHTTVLSPPSHSTFSNAKEMLEFIDELRDLSNGKPVGFKLCLGQPQEFDDICRAMIETGRKPDFISVDGAEGGTGAAPLEFTDRVGIPLEMGLVAVVDLLRKYDLKKDIKVIASGKIVTAFGIIKSLSLGADLTNSARGMMLALGCIHAQKCDTNECPAGVATQDKHLMKGLDVNNKAERVYNFHKNTIHSFLELVAATGVDSPQELTRKHILKYISDTSKIDLIPMVGIGYQGLEVEINQGYIKSDLVGINHVKYYMNNPAFIFYLGLEFRVPVGSKSAISIKGGYKLDVSNKKWKYQDDKINVESNVGGVYAQVSLCFGNFKRKGSIAQDAISPIE